MAAGSALLIAVLWVTGPYETIAAATRYGGFQFVSAATCTGFQTAVDATTVPLGRWPAESQLLIAGGMVIGWAAGSTAGGIKIVRALTLLQGIRFRIADVFYPDSAVRRLDIGDRRLDDSAATQEVTEAAIIAILWASFLIAGTFLLLGILPEEFSLATVVFEVASAQGNVGLSSGITGLESLPTIGKVAFLGHMLIGRLEIIPVIVALRALISHKGWYA